MKERCTVVKLNLQFHEDSAIFSVAAVERGGKTVIATAGGDKAIRLWEYAYTGEPPREEFEYKTALSEGCAITHIFTLAKHKGSVNSVEFSKDGKYLVSGGDTGTVFLWDVEEVMQSTPSEEDRKYQGQPVLVRESDGADIYEVKWFAGKILVGTSAGRVEQYALSTVFPGNSQGKEKAKGGGVLPESAAAEQGGKEAKKPGVKIRMIEEFAPSLAAKCVSSKQVHKDTIQGIACTEGMFATIGNDRVVKVFSQDGKLIQKVSKKSLISDKHAFFFRRLFFGPDGSLYLPSATHEGKNTVNILSPPEYRVTKAIQGFSSSTVCALVTQRFLVVSEGRNLYVFSEKEHALAFRIADCAFLPITDVVCIQDTPEKVSLLVSSNDGFLSNLIVYSAE
ncbi:chromatin assembly factor 1 subunit B [Nematocida major]|uniref:chromatin assembly factor 1 subunit B n=1 Tax=Nematocida major TaxID=1912982 RepID=UPI002008B964|nr:chromatin assembly factor 1 subunit B [Nematocida major]KAH9386689.1 chromatin assembly factor 1 subunit B [Nematocida major]